MFSNFSKSFMKGITTFFTTERIVILVVFLVLIFALAAYANNKTSVLDGMNTGMEDEEPKKKSMEELMPKKEGYTTQSVANPSDLLPKDENSDFAALNPSSMNKGDVLMPDLLQAGHHVGVDTVGQSLRNANLQIRSEPANPQVKVSPWQQTTIEPDTNRRPLEIANE